MAIELSHEMHMQGLSAFSGAETALLQARVTLGELEIELNRAMREAKVRGCDTKDLRTAIEVMQEVSKDLLARRACLMELHRNFRAIDDELTPIRSPSDAAMKAFQVSSNFPRGKP